jgi:hypothetical protein
VNCVDDVENGRIVDYLVDAKEFDGCVTAPMGGRNLLDYISCCTDDKWKTVNEIKEVVTTGTFTVTADSANNDGATVSLSSSIMGSLPAT